MSTQRKFCGEMDHGELVREMAKALIRRADGKSDSTGLCSCCGRPLPVAFFLADNGKVSEVPTGTAEASAAQSALSSANPFGPMSFPVAYCVQMRDKDECERVYYDAQEQRKLWAEAAKHGQKREDRQQAKNAAQKWGGF